MLPTIPSAADPVELLAVVVIDIARNDPDEVAAAKIATILRYLVEGRTKTTDGDGPGDAPGDRLTARPAISSPSDVQTPI